MRIVFAFAFLLGGCGGAVVDESSSSSSSSANLRCDVVVGEDVCARPFDLATRETLESVTSLASLASEQLVEVETACRNGIVDLGGDEGDIAKPCDALVLAIGTSGSRLTVTTTEPDCQAVDPPTCAASNSVRTRCTGGALVATAPTDGDAQEEAVAAMMTRRYGPVVSTKRTVAAMTDRVGELSRTISPRIASECQPGVSRIAADAARDAQELTRVVGLLAASIDQR